MTDKPVTLAAIVGAHGVTGEVRLKLFGQGPDSLKAYKGFDAGAKRLTLKTIRPGPTGAVARFAEIGGRTEAEGLRGTALTVPRSALPPLAEGEFYHIDLMDLPCISDAGEALGHVVAVENFGAGDILEIERPSVDGKPGKRFMVPIHAAQIGDDQAVIDSAFVD